MKSNYYYTCQTEKVEKIGKTATISADLNYCKPYKAKNDPTVHSDGVPLQTYEQCVKHEAYCQKYGPSN